MGSLKKNIVFSTILTTANYIFPLITYLYVSRVLGVQNIGLCNFIDSVINYFILFSTMGMSILGIREIARVKNDKSSLNITFSSLFILNTITTLIMLLLLVFLTIYVPKLRLNWHLMLIGAFKLIFNLFLVEWLYKGLEEFKFITLRTVFVKCLYVLAVFLFVKNTEDYIIFYIISALMIIVNATINIVYSRQFVCFVYAFVNVRQYVKPFFILGLYNLLTSMYTSFNVTYLGFVSTNTEVGFYTTATKLYNILLSVYTAFSGVMLPRMSSLYADGKSEEFIRLIRKSFSILLFFAIPTVIISEFNAQAIIYVIAGQEYGGAVVPFMIVLPLMLIIGFEMILIQQILMPMQKDKAITINSVCGALVGMLCNIILVHKFDAIGSSLSWVISEIVVLCLAIYEAKLFLGMNFPIQKLARVVCAYLPLILIFLISHYYILNIYYCLCMDLIILIPYVYIINVGVIKDINFRKYLGT